MGTNIIHGILFSDLSGTSSKLTFRNISYVKLIILYVILSFYLQDSLYGEWPLTVCAEVVDKQWDFVSICRETKTDAWILIVAEVITTGCVRLCPVCAGSTVWVRGGTRRCAGVRGDRGAAWWRVGAWW